MQAAQQPDKHAGHSQCLQTEFGQVCCAQSGGQKPFQPVVFEGVRGVEAVDHLSTGFGDVKFEDPETLRSVQTEFGEVIIVGMSVWTLFLHCSGSACLSQICRTRHDLSAHQL